MMEARRSQDQRSIDSKERKLQNFNKQYKIN